MRGPKLAAAAILALFGGSVVAIHLMYLPDTAPGPATKGPARPPAVAATQRVAPAAPMVPVVAAVPAVREMPAAPEAPPPPTGVEIPGLPSLGVTRPLPAPTASAEWEQALNDCIERNIRGRGYDELRPIQPARRPALKRAREQRRLLRLQARTACERELAG
jgi:hypothetical protein